VTLPPSFASPDDRGDLVSSAGIGVRSLDVRLGPAAVTLCRNGRLSTRPPVRELSRSEIEQTLAEHQLYLETEYREGHRANFATADLSGQDFSGLNLRGIKMDRAALRGVDFTGTHLQGANLIGAILQEARFDRADLTGARLSGANLVSASLEDACLAKADMEFALMAKVLLRDACLREADMSGAQLDGAVLTRANLQKANLRDRQVVLGWVLRYDQVNRAHNPCLGVGCRFPAADTLLRVRKERVGCRLKFLLRKVTGGRSIVLAESGIDAVPSEAEPGGENVSCITRFTLAARKNAAHPPCPRPGGHRAHPSSTAAIERPIGNGDARIDRHIGMGDEENRRHRNSTCAH
jgi:hypothetical protein